MSAREEEWGTFNGEIYQRGEVFVRASCEIEFMLKLGYDLEILDGIVFPRTEAVMKKFFLDIYKVKAENKTLGKHLTTAATGVFGFDRTNRKQVKVVTDEYQDCMQYSVANEAAVVKMTEGCCVLYRESDCEFRDCNVAIFLSI